MKKKLLLLVISFLLVGCTNEYTIEIKDKTIKESFLSSVPIQKENEENEECKDAYPECDNNQYEIVDINMFPLLNQKKANYTVKKYTENNNVYSLRTYDFTYDDYAYSSALNKCFNSQEYEYEKGNIYIYANDFSKCYQNSDVTVKVVTDYKVFQHNADKKEGNTYIWYINEDNYNTVDISIRLRAFSFVPYIIYSVLGIAVIGGIFYLYRKTQKVNEIN